MSNTQKYLEEYVKTIPQYVLSDSEKKTIQFQGIENYIYNKLSSSKFKGSALPEKLQLAVKEKIGKSAKQGKPIHMTIPFGGYKKWQLPTYPNADWSEVFNIVLLREYLAPIAAEYKHGLILQYVSDEVFVARMNNYPQKDIDSYNDQLKSIIDWFQDYLPKNFQLKYSKIRDNISQKEILKRFDKDIVKLKKKWTKLPQKERDFRLNKSERNYKGDLSKLPKKEKDQILLDSTMVHDAFIFGDWDDDVSWAFDEMMIAIGFRYTGSWGIHLKSTRSSTNQFWIGMGALKDTKKGFVPTSLTYEQYLKVKSKLGSEKVSVFPDSFENLQKIMVFKSR